MKRNWIFVTSLLMYIGLQGQNISEVIEYKPAPGQFINQSGWGTTENANSLIGGMNGHVCLGAFGGYVVFKFKSPVKNESDNPYGIDFLIYGNPLKNVANLDVDNNVTWSEPGIVSVMKDENGNGKPDDTWYELAGCDHYLKSCVRNYEVTYVNPKQEQATDVSWTDNLGGSGKILKNEYYYQPYYPTLANFSNVDQDQYTLSGTKLKSRVDKSKPGFVTSFGRPWGYVDNNMRAFPYNALPDNPYTDNVEENSGGDAFDIDWAIDENGNYVNLDQVDFIKVHTAVMDNAGWLGEVSTEISGAVDIAPNKDVTGELDFVLGEDWDDTLYTNKVKLPTYYAFHKGRIKEDYSCEWSASSKSFSLLPEGEFIVNETGDLELKAKLSHNKEVFAKYKTYIRCLSLTEQTRHVSALVDDENKEFNLSTFVKDSEDENAKISFQLLENHDKEIVSVDLDAANLSLNFQKEGETEVWLKASGEKKSVYFCFNVLVGSDARPVVIKQIKDIEVTQAATDSLIKLNTVFSKIGSTEEQLVFEIMENSNDATVKASLSKGILRLHFEDAGTSQLKIKASLGDEFVEQSFEVLVNATSGINKSIESEIVIYPNPVRNRLYLKGISEANVQVFNVLGQLIKSLNWETAQGGIDISALPSGTYLLRIETGKNIYLKRFIKAE